MTRRAKAAVASPPAAVRSKPARNRRKPRSEPKPPMAARAELALSRVGLDRPGRERVQSYLVRGAVAVTAVAMLVAVLGLLERHIKTSKSFAIEQIEVTGNEQLTDTQVLRAAGLALGQNVFAMGPEQARANLLKEPWIEAADVRRRLPGRFSIELRERRAVALLAGGPLQLVSDEGLAFKALDANDPSDLPVISGLDPDLRAQDERALSTSLLDAVALLHAYQDAGLSRREPISEIHVENDRGLSLYVGGDAMYVRLGKGPFRQKLERMREVLTRLAKDKARAAYVYLDNQRRQDRVVARLR